MMKTICKIFLAVVLQFSVYSFVQAQDPDSGEQAVYEMFEAQGMKEQMNQIMLLTLQNQMKAIPQIREFQNDFMIFLIKTISYDAVKKDLAKIYLKHFTIEEIREITKFYKSPVGKKMRKSSYPIMVEANELANRKLQKELPSFLKSLEEKRTLKK